MQARTLFLLLIALFFYTNTHAQRTVGTLFETEEALDGYTFFSPFSSTNAYMVDNCGRLINQWNRGALPGLSAYFLDNGLMLRTYKPDPIGPFTSASNAGGLELVDWDNNTVWSYEFNTPTLLSHHDVVMMPNGNLLVLLWELIYFDELVELGRDPNEIAPQGFAWNEKIVEIERVGNNDINIVWEWKIKDHYIQDFDASKQNYGVISAHPELFDINLAELESPNSHSDLDYNHFNAIDYNEALDQILISVRNSDEIWIIDHSTSIAEAASHVGGRYNKGGDILYRWGNPAAYQRGTSSYQKLFGQHGVHWIKEGADAGKIMIFNNGNGRFGNAFSSIEILVPHQNIDGSYPIDTALAFGPSTVEWSYGNSTTEYFYSAYLSNAQRLPNGHTLINVGSLGRIFEIDENKELVWDYEIPLYQNNPVPQGNTTTNNASFRAYKFPKNFKGFEGIEITAGDPIEIDPMPLECIKYNAVGIEEINTLQQTIQSHFSDGFLQIINNDPQTIQMNLFDISGRSHWQAPTSSGTTNIALPHLPSGIYILHFESEGQQFQTKVWLMNE